MGRISKLTSHVCGCLLVVGVAMGGCRDNDVATTKRAVTASPVDFGRQTELTGTEGQRIVLRNGSEHEVRVVKTAVGCGCISVDVGGGLDVAAGADAAITVVLDRSRMKYGAAEYPVALTLSDGRQVLTTVAYSYIPRVDVVPSSLVLSAAGSPAEFQVILEPDEETRIDSVEAQDLSIEVVKVATGDDSTAPLTYRVAVPRNLPRPMESAVLVKLTDGTVSSIALRVLPRGGEPVTPATLTFHPFPSGGAADEKLERTVVVRTSAPSDVVRFVSSTQLVRVGHISTSRIGDVYEGTYLVTLSPQEYIDARGHEPLDATVDVYLNDDAVVLATIAAFIAP